jgi:Bacteriophage minor capsid protein
MTSAILLYDMATVFLPAYNSGSLSLTFGTDLFAGLMPNSPDNCVTLFEYPGEAPEYTMGPTSLPAISKPRLQVLVRNLDYMTGRAQIEAVVSALETICNETINSTLYERVARTQEPSFLHRDAARRIFFVANMEVQRSPT